VVLKAAKYCSRLEKCLSLEVLLPVTEVVRVECLTLEVVPVVLVEAVVAVDLVAAVECLPEVSLVAVCHSKDTI
jgi:hypothetical protein